MKKKKTEKEIYKQIYMIARCHRFRFSVLLCSYLGGLAECLFETFQIENMECVEM